MGLFHCPLGAAYYDDETCIDCGLCNASTPEEKVQASRKIREYVKSHASRNTRVRKIAICGKGGAGKSTVTALLAQSFVEAGYSVIVLDSDDSNPCLARMLGIEPELKPLNEMLKEENEVSEESTRKLSIDELPQGYVISIGRIKFILAGKIVDPFQGCACSLAGSARLVLEKLQIRDNEVLILDTEAGVESFGRGVERDVDAVIAVVEPSHGSVELAARIADMARGMGINRVGAILNKVGNGDIRNILVQKVAEKSVPVMGIIRESQLLSEASLEGKQIILQADARIYEDITEVVKNILSGQIPEVV